MADESSLACPGEVGDPAESGLSKLQIATLQKAVIANNDSKAGHRWTLDYYRIPRLIRDADTPYAAAWLCEICALRAFIMGWFITAKAQTVNQCYHCGEKNVAYVRVERAKA